MFQWNSLFNTCASYIQLLYLLYLTTPIFFEHVLQLSSSAAVYATCYTILTIEMPLNCIIHAADILAHIPILSILCLIHYRFTYSIYTSKIMSSVYRRWLLSWTSSNSCSQRSNLLVEMYFFLKEHDDENLLMIHAYKYT